MIFALECQSRLSSFSGTNRTFDSACPDDQRIALDQIEPALLLEMAGENLRSGSYPRR
jgi:hypothetical protein